MVDPQMFSDFEASNRARSSLITRCLFRGEQMSGTCLEIQL